MAIKIDGQDLLKKFIGWQEIVRIYKNGGEIRPNTVPPVPKPWLCFTANEIESTVQLNKIWNPTAVTLEISTDWNNWNTYSIWNTITLSNVWDKVYRRNTSEITTWFSSDEEALYYFIMAWSISASWNVTSLINKNCTDTILTAGCFFQLFLDCYSLTTAPELPATTLTNSCYYAMFMGCASLTTAPELPATTLADFCYDSMFEDSSLTIPPQLPATTLARGCYLDMFNSCPLTALPQLPATTLAKECYLRMFDRCDSIKLSETQIWEYQTPYRIPTNWIWTEGTDSLRDMFRLTWGRFTGTPEINRTYYTSNTVI